MKFLNIRVDGGKRVWKPRLWTKEQPGLKISPELKRELERIATEPDSELVEFDSIDEFLAALGKTK